MRRWLTLLLLVLLPLQFTWTAAAVYCQHEGARETSAGIGHFGHHEHEHPATLDVADVADVAGVAHVVEVPAGADDPTDFPRLSVDSDCGYCQLSATKPVQRQPPALSAEPGAVSPDATATRWQTRDPDRLERPDWRLA